jgi:rhamnulose-1-phosphate aldolase/alcohol dehydrogenase
MSGRGAIDPRDQRENGLLVEGLWEPEKVPENELEQLVYRSNLLGAERSVANFGGGNTSAKLRQTDHAGRTIEVLWVKGSGSDLATIEAAGFAGLRMEEIAPLIEREEMSDAEMVDYLSRCQLAPNMPRGSIETLLHAFTPAPHVDHTHPDAINAICGAVDGERLARECFGEEMIWIPYIRPGFELSKQVGTAIAANPEARVVLLAKHGLVTWGETAEESYRETIAAINEAAEFVERRAEGPRLGGQAVAPLDPDRREELLADLLPAARGAVSSERPKILQVDTSPAAMEFVCSADAPALSQVGAACPDHLVHTKRIPLWIDYDPESDDAETLAARVAEAAEAYREDYTAYVSSWGEEGTVASDPDPRVILIAGVGIVTAGPSLKAAQLSRDLYQRAIAVMAGAAAIDEFTSLTEEESFAVEYWPLELYKLSLAPPPRELAGMVAFVTGGGGGIGGAVVEALAAEGACVVAADIDLDSARQAVEPFGDSGLAVAVDVTEEEAVARAFDEATLALGGVDIVVSNAGVAASQPIEETTVADWDFNHSVLARGYFLVSREAFSVFRQQGTPANIVFVGSKNGLVAGRNAAAYSSAKAAELHLARCLAEEGGENGIRVNTVNPDAVLAGSKIWSSSWRQERARAYEIDSDQLEEHYRQRTTLKVNVQPQDIAEAVLFLASPRSLKSTGNVVNVDGGIPAAYPR